MEKKFTKEKYQELHQKFVNATQEEKEVMDTRQSANPAPSDGITLKQIAKLSNYKTEIKKIKKEMEGVANKSCIYAMYAHGYGFSWSQLKTIADFLDMTDGDTVTTQSVEQDSIKGATVVYLKPAEDACRCSMTMSKKVHQAFDILRRRYSSAVYDAALLYFLKEIKMKNIEIKYEENIDPDKLFN